MKRAIAIPRFRFILVVTTLALITLALLLRAAYLQIWNSDYLQKQGNARFLRVVSDAPYRGMILDRNGEPLAISTPVESIWAQPEVLLEVRDQWPRLARKLDISQSELARQVRHHQGKEFMYLKRQVSPEFARSVTELDIPGVSLQREYRRYYPAGEAAGHIIGFTNVDDNGQEGVELAFNDWLSGKPGRKRVLKDRLGNIVESVESITLPERGRDLVLSIDRRIQYLAYRELKEAVAQHKAKGGTAVVMDVRSGEVLAMVNQPGFNPNNRKNFRSRYFRNRAVTDLFEPGSTLKPFTIAAALESGRFSPRSLVNTSPGAVLVGSKTISDEHNFGWLTLTRVIEKSSNVGAAKIALQIGKQSIWDMLTRVGFGEETHSGLPGEVSGLINPPDKWAKLDHATVSFGYGISVTSLQLARAYAAIANNGYMITPTLVRTDAARLERRVLPEDVTHQLRYMLERAVGTKGTGQAADIAHYRVAGKTGTVHKLIDGQYAEDRYMGLFAGMVPASNPRLVMVVTIDDPHRGGYFGGQIAAPVFRKVMSGALRLLDIAPDQPHKPGQQLVQTTARPAV
ncbi:MAG: cell division protein [Acidithiobacillales bacterium SG8_45]|jgi:cell division protein FtsI (penicillin-binding protein 3)|nr:MAG: cell division protein [Acidithiobacillales bacterium SG8_45]